MSDVLRIDDRTPRVRALSLDRSWRMPRALYDLLSGRRTTGREAGRTGLASLKCAARRAPELPMHDGLVLERRMQFCDRHELPAMALSDTRFAAGNAAPHEEKS